VPDHRVSISVIVCSHNPRLDYLTRTLEGLKNQTLDHDEWELILVDNNSDVPISDRVDVSWARKATVVREETLGLTPARLTGIRLSAGELLVFVDDDNVLDSDFLETAATIAADKPFLGSWSGQCRPEFEVPPPEWTRRYWGNLVIREFDSDIWSNLPRLADSMPCGAGLCVRRAAAFHYVHLHESGQRASILDRSGSSLFSGGDNDLAACACDMGLSVGLIASLRLTHIIPPERLTADYIERLVEGIYASSTILDWERGIPAAKRTLRRRMADAARDMTLAQPHRRILRAARRGHELALAHLKQIPIPTPNNRES
jgi:glycosyltransferase involved in cell wall biosynthesis